MNYRFDEIEKQMFVLTQLTLQLNEHQKKVQTLIRDLRRRLEKDAKKDGKIVVLPQDLIDELDAYYEKLRT